MKFTYLIPDCEAASVLARSISLPPQDAPAPCLPLSLADLRPPRTLVLQQSATLRVNTDPA